MNPLPASYDETMRTYQQENRQLWEAHKRTEARLDDLTELLHKFASQMAVNSQPPSSSNPLLSQPLPNPKGRINMVQTTSDKGAITEAGANKEDEDEEDDDWLYDLFAKLAKINSDNEHEYEDAEEEEMTEEDEDEEMIEIDEEATKNEKRTPRNNNGSNSQVLLGRPFLKTSGFKLNFYDETFSIEVGNIIEMFQPARPPISQEESEEESVVAAEPKETANKAVTPKVKKDQKTPTPAQRSKEKKEDTKSVKKKKPERRKEERNVEFNCTTFKDLIWKLKRLNNAIVKDGGIGVHLVEDNSKWK
ncbi:hypothetical protein PIB30_068937 [Stylosanthes scabra]|uniref:Uncharacterized protein n=1 Tax=Stylosanthes scabra TaxID=79078 RepID=A0ABU6VLG5_9FABA|nr:hypothetical protein [Stylosanthes scabra]